MHSPMLPRIHPFWLTLAYGIFVGYQVRKNDIDKKIMACIHTHQDQMLRRQANVLLDVAEERSAVVLRPETVREAVMREKAKSGTEK